MAWIAACPGCVSGHHEDHIRNWNIRPGLIGGAWCDCEGEPGCSERFAEFAARLLAEIFPPVAAPNPEDDATHGSYPVWEAIAASKRSERPVGPNPEDKQA